MQNILKFKKFLQWLPILEIIVFVVVSSIIGFWLAFLLILASSGCGLVLIRKYGGSSALHLNQMQWWQQTLTHESLEKSLFLIASFLLFVPGFITDIVALVLFIKPIRKRILNWLQQHGYTQTQTSSTGETHRVIDGEFWREENKDQNNP